MCMQDIDIARQLRTRIYSTAVSNLIPANPSRLSIRICPGAGERVDLTSPGWTVQGLTIPSRALLGYAIGYDGVTQLIGTLPDDVTLERVGDILKGPLEIVSTGNVDNYLIETYLDVMSPMPLDVSTLP